MKIVVQTFKIMLLGFHGTSFIFSQYTAEIQAFIKTFNGKFAWL